MSDGRPVSDKADQVNRLALYLPSLRGGGAERVMVTLANAFAERGYAVDLVLVSAEGPYLVEVSDAVRIVDLGCSRVLFSLPRLARYLRKERPRVLLSAMGHANAIAVLARGLSRVPTRVVVSERNHFSVSIAQSGEARNRFLERRIRKIYRLADGIIAVSTGVADDLAKHAGLPRKKISVVYNPVWVPRIQKLADETVEPRLFHDGDGPLIVAMGRLVKQKGFSILLRAFARLRAQRAARLVILGEGELRESLEGEIGQLGLAADVILPGFAHNPFPLLRDSDLFVLSSLWEGLPNGMIQAMACGTPVVASDCPSGPAEILGNGRWGRLVPVGDVNALAAAMAATLDDKSHPDVVSRAADFNLDQAVDGYLKVMLPEELGGSCSAVKDF
jgi:glycosyltransferase involved in cell wall biosynthesis